MKILGIEADNPFSLFLILILLLAASGTFDPKAAAEEESEESSVGALQKKGTAKKPVWQTRPGQSLFQKRQVRWGSNGKTSPFRRLQFRRELVLPFARVMPLGR